jgi:hypothetical protein
MTDKLVLLDAGESALNNADAGGILINPASFKMGDSALYATSTQHTNIVGNFVVGGTIHHVEVLSARVARFVLTVDTRTLTGPVVAKELVVFFENNIAFARAVFETPYTLLPNEPIRLSVVLATSRADLTTINVAVGEYDTIPSTPFLYRLPTPGNSEFNVISVLNGRVNPDGTNSPVLAMRYGAGAFQWGFTDHKRVFNGVPVSATDTSFKISDTSGYAANEQVIVHVVAGSGEGATRRYRFNQGAGEFRDVDSQALPNLSASTIAIWQMQVGNGSGGSSDIPDTTDIPSDWVLTPGTDGSLIWQPPAAASRIISTLYTPPSKLDVNALNLVGSGDTARYTTGELIAENANYIYAALGTATQHRSAFELAGSEVEFAENIPSTVPIDFRVFTKSPSTGTRVVFTTLEFVSDGSKTEFDLGMDVDDSAHIWAFVSNLLQPTTTYSIDTTLKKLKFTSPPEAGLNIELRLMTYVQETGYSTRIVTKSFYINSDTFYLKLPTTPQAIEQVFISQSGAHVHQLNYQIIDDYAVFTSSLDVGLEVEVMIFENVQSQGSESTGLNGMVIDGYVSHKNLVLLRHGASPIELPIPEPKISVGTGLRVLNGDGMTTIELDDDAFPTLPQFRSYTADATEKAANAIVTYPISLTQPMFLLVTCDFNAKLGPGYVSVEGSENIEFVIGVRSSSSKEPEFGRAIRGTGETGLIVAENSKSSMAYGRASMTQIFELDPANHNTGEVEVVAKMRINNANTAQYSTVVNINFNVVEIPKT